jgi:hypothetical protein
MCWRSTCPTPQPKDASGNAGPDLSSHPWAGLEVQVQLLARDGAGQEGRSEAATLTLPERAFGHPVAQALIALRKSLSLDPARRREAQVELDRLAGQPEAFEHDTNTFLALRSARHRLARDRRAEAVAEAQETMWETALALEEGRAERTARALEQAIAQLREQLEQAMREQQENREATPPRKTGKRKTGKRRTGKRRTEGRKARPPRTGNSPRPSSVPSSRTSSGRRPTGASRTARRHPPAPGSPGRAAAAGECGVDANRPAEPPDGPPRPGPPHRPHARGEPPGPAAGRGT